MTGVVQHSMFNQQRLDPASFQSQFSPIQTTPSISFCPSASGELELFLEATPCVNFFDLQLQQLIASAMSFQHHSIIDQGQIQPQASNNSQQQMSADAAPFPFDNSSQQTSMLQPSPSFVEPSGNYNEIPTTTTTNTFYATNNLENAGNNTYSPRNFGPSQQSQQHPQTLIPNYNNYHYQGYQSTVPSSIGSSIGSNSCQHKPIPGGITTAATTLPINISGQNLFLPQYNQNNPLLLPVYDSSTIFTTKPSVNTTIPTTVAISQNSPVTTSENNNTPKPYSYGGPPKSYYSRLPLYDRPFKCDQCPQSFNRNHDLKRHKRIHLAVKPYPCPYCEKQFSRKDALKRHILVKGCNNTNNGNNKRSTSPKSGNKKVESTTTTTTTSISSIENYVDNESTIKTEPMGDNNNYGMSI